MPRALVVEIIGNAKQFAAELDRAAGKTRQMGKVAGVAGLAIAGGLAVGLEHSVKAAMEAQTQTARLDQAFKSAGDSSGKYAGAITNAESQARKLGFTNVDVRTSLGSLETATKNGAVAIKDLGVAQDLARFSGKSLEDSTKTLTTAMAGSQRAAKQLGIIIPSITTNYDALKASGVDLTTHEGHLLEAHAKLLDKMATGQAVIAEVTKRVHGQAQAFADTAAGGMAQFHAQVGAIEESLGQALLPIVAKVTTALADLAGYFAKHATLAKILVAGLGVLAASLLAVSAATWAVNVAMDANPIGAVIVGVVALTAVLIVLQEKFHIVTKAVDFLNEHLYLLIAVPVVGWTLFVAGEMIKHWNAIKDIAGGAIDAVTSAVNALVDAFKSVVNWVQNVIGWFKTKWPIPDFGGIVGAINAITNALKELVSWAKDALGFLSDVFSSSGSKGPPGGPRGWGPPPQKHAAGGIFTSPTLGIIGEAGPEAVIPLDKMGGLGGNVTVNVTGWVGNDQDLAYKIRDELVRIGRREHGALAGFA